MDTIKAGAIEKVLTTLRELDGVMKAAGMGLTNQWASGPA